MNKTSSSTGHAGRNGALALLAASALAAPWSARAQAIFNPYVSAQAEYDSNVFRVENSAVAEQYYRTPDLADTDFRYIAGASGTYSWGRQKLSGTVEGREIRYDRFNFLNHSEYLANVQLDWQLGNALDGLVQFRQEHLAAYFANSQSPYLEVDTDRNVVAQLNLKFHTDWRLETGANIRDYRAPLQFYPDFVEHEKGTHLGVSYLGVADLTYGVGVDRIDGSYVHAVGVGPYTQTSVSLRTTYTINGLQTVTGSAGYTRRDQSTGGNFGAVTGQLRYTRQLTGKTSVYAQFTRSVNSYIASAGSEIDTSGSLGATWAATYKLAVNLNLGYTASQFFTQSITVNNTAGSATAGRTDHSPNAGLNLTYQALRQLQIKGYVNAQSRSSNYEFNRYHDTTAGIQLLAHWR